MAISSRNSDLNQILPNIAKDFADIKIGFIKLARLNKQQSITRSFEKIQYRKASYIEKFLKVKVEKVEEKKTIGDHAKDFASMLGTIMGVLGGIFAVLGVAGIVQMISSSNVGKHLGKFVSNIFEGLISFVEKSITIIQDVMSDSTVKSALVKTISSIFRFIGDAFLKGFEIAKTLLSDSEVLKSIGKILVSVMSAIYDTVMTAFDTVKDLFSQNLEPIKDGIVKLFSKIADILVPILSILGDVLLDSRFLESLGKIAQNMGDLIVTALKYEYEMPNGERKNLLTEIGLLIGEIALVHAAILLTAAKIRNAAAEIAASKFMSGECDCGLVTPEKPTSGTPGKEGARKGPPLEKIKNARDTKATNFEKIKYFLEKKWKQLALLAEKFRYSKIGQNKIIDLAIRLCYRYGVKVAESTLYKAIVSVLGNVVAYTTSFTGVGAVVSFAWTIVNWALWGYLAYEVAMILFDNVDELNDDIEKEEQKSAKPEKVTNAASLTAALQPTKAETPTEPVRKITDYAKPTTAPAPAPSDKKTMGPAPMAPTQQFQQSESLKAAQEYLGREIDAKEWDYLMRAVYAEGSGRSKEEYAHIMAVILNRARKDGSRIQDVLYAKNQFQSVTGTASNPRPSDRFIKGPYNTKDLAMIMDSASALTGISKNMDAFTAADPKAYKAGTNTAWLDKLKNSGGKQIGGTIFAENLYTRGKPGSVPTSEMPVLAAAAPKPEIKEETKQKSLAGMMFASLSEDLQALDQLTGGKLGLATNEMKSMLRGLEDEANKGTNFFNVSTNILNNTTENKPNNSGTKDTNESILSAILNRQYA